MGTCINRRQILAMGAGVAATIAASKSSRAQAGGASSGVPDFWKPVEDIIQAQGMFSNGVFSIEIDRNDIDDVTIHGVPILPSFEINGTLYFQRVGHDETDSGGGDADDKVYLNGDLALKPTETNAFIDALISHGLYFQAFHQHMYDFDPIVWFMHFRKLGSRENVASSIKAALDVTSTPFPQMMPSNPTTPLPADKIGKILGAMPTIGSDGVVTYDIPRKDRIILGGIRVNPYLNVDTNIAFEPLNNSGTSAAAIPDYGMVASEINAVVGLERKLGWDIGCLYNQETDEHPQLYFSHQFKTGDPIQLAHEIRRGLHLMDVKFMS